MDEVPTARCTDIVVIVSADAEWRVIRSLYSGALIKESRRGEWFIEDMPINGVLTPILLFHGGWGKIAASASAQWIIDLVRPSLLVNLGTCGGIRGILDVGDILLVEKVIVYDILEQMYDGPEASNQYETRIDLSWLKTADYPHDVLRSVMLSADRDLDPQDVPKLREKYNAVAADWESGSIAWVAQRNGVPCLILRGVSDTVGDSDGDAYGNPAIFELHCAEVMELLVNNLPNWLGVWRRNQANLGDREA